MQKLIGSYLADYARNTNVDVIYCIGSHCTNLSSQQNMDQYNQKLTLLYFLFMQFYVSQGMLAQLSLMPLIQMFTMQEHTYLISFLVC